jgi:hypothetical protein
MDQQVENLIWRHGGTLLGLGIIEGGETGEIHDLNLRGDREGLVDGSGTLNKGHGCNSGRSGRDFGREGVDIMYRRFFRQIVSMR